MDASKRLPPARRARLVAPVSTFVTAWADFADQDDSADLHPVEASGDEESFVTPWSGFEDVTINIAGPDALLVELDDSSDDGPDHGAYRRVDLGREEHSA
jgi:hypothetical protein